MTATNELLRWKHPENESDKSRAFGRSLIIGAGATSGTLIPMARKYCSEITCTTRPSENGRQAHAELQRSNGMIYSQGLIAGEAGIDTFCLGWEHIRSTLPPNTIFLCTPNQNYAENVREVAESGLLNPGQTIVGISTRVGSGAEISNSIQESGFDPGQFNVISISTYYAATKPVPEQRTTVSTRAVKKRVFLGCSQPGHTSSLGLQSMLSEINTYGQIVEGTLPAELNNANTFVHAQLTISPDTLNDIFRQESERDYIYRPEPEGCLSNASCQRMAKASDEINRILTSLKFPNINLLEMLQKDLYPVPGFDTHIEDFPSRVYKEKGDLLYTWFQGRQKDPQTGKPHLEAVKLQRVYADNGYWRVPRIPGEDYVTLVVLKQIAEGLKVSVPTINEMVSCFEQKVQSCPVKTDVDIDSVHNHAVNIATITINGIR